MKKRNILMLFIVTLIITFSINVYADDGCSGTGISNFICNMNQYVYKPIKWGTPAILLLLTSFDFAKVVFSGDGKGMDKAKNNFLKRSIAALIIFFAPEIIELIAGFIDPPDISSISSGIK